MATFRVLETESPVTFGVCGSPHLAVTLASPVWRWTCIFLVLDLVFIIVLYALYTIRQQFVLKRYPGRRKPRIPSSFSSRVSHHPHYS